MFEFGENTWFKIPHTKHQPGTFEQRFERGTYLGFIIRSGEHVVGTEEGVFRVTNVRRAPAEERWSLEIINKIIGTPEQPVPDVRNRRVPTYAKKFTNKDEQKEPKFVPQEEPDIQVRGFKIFKRDIDENGPTPNCQGCRAILKGATYKANHTPLCRVRF